MKYVFFHEQGLLAGRFAMPGWYVDTPVGHLKLSKIDASIASSLVRKGIRTIKLQNEAFPII